MRGRRSTGFALVGVLFLVGVAAAHAGRVGVDRTFGGNGVVPLEQLLPGERSGFVSKMAVGPGRGIFLLDTAGRCESGSCSADVYVVRRLPNGSPDLAYGQDGAAIASAGLPGAAWSISSLTVDAQGRALVAIDQLGQILVMRLTGDGSPDPSFGSMGKATFACDCTDEAPPALLVDASGRILVEGAKRFPSGGPTGEEATVVRLTPSGALDESFGSGGRARMILPATGFLTGWSLGHDGSLIAAAVDGCCSGASPPGFKLIRIRADGTVDNRFAGRSRRALRALTPNPERGFVSVGALIRRAHGEVDVLGSNFFKGFVARVRADGGLDRRFGGDGIKWVDSRISSAVPGGAGRVFAVGPGAGGDLKAVLLTRDGRPGRSYARQGPVILSSWHQFAGLAMQGRRPLLFDNGAMSCRGPCPPQPKLVRLTALPRPDGHHRR